MNRHVFNEIFCEIMSIYHIDSTELGEKIDRDSSRIRHYKRDGRPGRAVLDQLIFAICEIVAKRDDDDLNTDFMKHTNELVLSKELFSEEARTILLSAKDIRTYLSFLLRTSCEASKSLRQPDVQPEAPSQSFPIISQVNQAHQFFTNNLYPEAENIYKSLLTCRELHDLPAYRQLMYTDLGLICRNQAFCQYNPELLKEAAGYFQIAAQLASDNKDLPNYGLIHKYLGTIYSFQYNFEAPEDNLKKSSKCYDIAMKALQKVTPLDEYYTVLNNYGILFLYYSNIRDTRSFLNSAVIYFKKAIAYADTHAKSYLKALACFNCSGAYCSLAEICDSVNNADRAIQMVNEALNVFTVEEYPVQYANCISTLAQIYFILAGCRDTGINSGIAINYIHRMLPIAKDTDMTVYLIAQQNLAAGYMVLSRHTDKHKNMEKAMQSLKECQTHYNEQTRSIQAIKSNLYNAEIIIEIGEAGSDLRLLKEARGLLYSQLALCQELGLSFYAAVANYLNARIYYHFYQAEQTSDDYDRIILFANKALEAFTANTFPLYYANTMLLFARVYSFCHDYKSSRTAYESFFQIITAKDYPVKYQEVIEDYHEVVRLSQIIE